MNYNYLYMCFTDFVMFLSMLFMALFIGILLSFYISSELEDLQYQIQSNKTINNF